MRAFRTAVASFAAAFLLVSAPVRAQDVGFLASICAQANVDCNLRIDGISAAGVTSSVRFAFDEVVGRPLSAVQRNSEEVVFSTRNGGEFGLGAIYRFQANGGLERVLSIDPTRFDATGDIRLLGYRAGELYGYRRTGAPFRLSDSFEPTVVSRLSKGMYGLSVAADGAFYGYAPTDFVEGGDEGFIGRFTPDGNLEVLRRLGRFRPPFDHAGAIGANGNYFFLSISGAAKELVEYDLSRNDFRVVHVFTDEDGEITSSVGEAQDFRLAADGRIYGLSTGSLYAISAAGEYELLARGAYALPGVFGFELARTGSGLVVTNRGATIESLGRQGKRLFDSESTCASGFRYSIFGTNLVPLDDDSFLRASFLDTFENDGDATRCELYSNPNVLSTNTVVARFTAEGQSQILSEVPPTKGTRPSSVLAVGPGGALYGSAQYGGPLNYGSVYRFNGDDGGVQVLVRPYLFAPERAGYSPRGGMAVLSDGRPVYTANRNGYSIFVIEADGSSREYYDTDRGCGPGIRMRGAEVSSFGGGIALTPDDHIIATVVGRGGENRPNDSYVFELSPEGECRVLALFGGQSVDLPGAPVLAPDGSIYGLTGRSYLNSGQTTSGISAPTNGGVYRISPSGRGELRYDISAEAGNLLFNSGLTLHPNGNLYGVAARPGSMIYEISPEQGFRILYRFDDQDGETYFFARANLVVGADGWLYGITQNGGDNAFGSIYRLSTDGRYEELHSFGGLDGAFPDQPVTFISDSTLVLPVSSFGPNGGGVIFELQVPEPSDGTPATPSPVATPTPTVTVSPVPISPPRTEGDSAPTAGSGAFSPLLLLPVALWMLCGWCSWQSQRRSVLRWDWK